MYDMIKTVFYVGADNDFHVGYMIEVKNVVVLCDSYKKAEQLLKDSTEIEKMILNLNEK